ncbi:MAG: N-6 DNA methylase [Pseudomonadota bacterium]|nr:N-6 DNA methylase [Pseudomonadota bacterium]
MTVEVKWATPDVMAENSLSAVISEFGAAAKAKLSDKAITGAPEDQLRAPLEALLKKLSEIGGLAKDALSLIGETTLSKIQTRPDYAATVQNALVGFIEVKAPGKGANPSKFTDPHDKAQWQKLKSLPNLLYTDGNGFSLWRSGQIEGKVVLLDGDIADAGKKLEAPATLLPLLMDFLRWNPIAPKSAKELARTSANLCRLLRDEVLELMGQGNASLLHLADDWRNLLFPDATDEKFADGYAQAITFGLLVARARNIPLNDGIDTAALKLKKTNTLIGTALSLLTDNEQNQKELKTSLSTLTRVLHEVNWSTVSKDKPEAWLYFYEDFLEVYDKALKKQTGSYYTPPEVVDAMVRLVDEALRGPLFSRALGLASADVTIADPAVGTGTFLLGVLQKIASNVSADQGEGAVSGAIRAAANRLYGFELQFGPFAVAQLRLLAEMQTLVTDEKGKAQADIPAVNLFITDTLGNPFMEEEQLPQIVEAVAKSRRDANKVKRSQPITVVIGNPPYKEKAEGRGGWIEKGSDGKPAPLDYWKAPPEWHLGVHGKRLKNLYIYFWRWASLKVFGSGLNLSTDLPEKDEEGLIAFITVAGFLNGPGFEKMRDDLRRTCSDIWVIDCSPEGHQPDVSSRIFEGVQQPVCIVVAARKLGKDKSKPAGVHFRVLAKGKREEKFKALAKISLNDKNWRACSTDFRASFLPEAIGLWAKLPNILDLFNYNGSGVMPGRTWIIAPDKGTLNTRWNFLAKERDIAKKEILFHPHLNRGKLGDRHLNKKLIEVLHGHEQRLNSVADDEKTAIMPTRYAYRSFDRQWIIPDGRLVNRPNPNLWNVFSNSQIYITFLHAHANSSGPSLTLGGHIPDLNHFLGSFGGRVIPLWQDANATHSNVAPVVLKLISESFGSIISPQDLMAYLACVISHPAFTARFLKDLKQPGLRVPLTADAKLFAEAANLGREVIWLHCYGERFVDDVAGRPFGPPRLPKNIAPSIPKGGAIPPAPEPLPDDMHYDATKQRLHIGKGYIDNVTPEIWAYEISGKNVLKQWFSYRKRDRSRPQIGEKRPPSPLSLIQPDGWLAEYTTDLLDLLNVLGRVIALHERQADLLTRICDGPLIALEDLQEAGIVPKAENAEADEEV